MRRLLLHLITALLTFSVGYSLAWATEVYNLKIEIREYERWAETRGEYDFTVEYLRQTEHGTPRVHFCPELHRKRGLERAVPRVPDSGNLH